MSDWTPEFDGQRAPFQPGNTVAVGNAGPLVHGASSPRHVDPLTKAIAAELKADIDYLNAPRFAERLLEYSRAEARSRLFRAWVATLDIADAASAGVEPPLERLRLLEGRASDLGDRLGLWPVVSEDVQKQIDAARRTLTRRAERKQLQADLRDALTQQLYGPDICPPPPSWHERAGGRGEKY